MKRILLLFIFITLFSGTVTASDFNSTWNTTYLSTGSTNNTSIKLPLQSGGTYDFTVWWGDGTNDTITAYDQANITHTYSAQGEYNVMINGTIVGWRFNNVGDKLKLTNIINWGTLRLGNSNSYFYGCSNLNVGATDTLDLTGTTTLYYAFGECSGITTLDVSAWDTSSVTTLYRAFWGCSGITTLNTSNWNVTSVVDATDMLYGVTLTNASYDDLLYYWSLQPLQNAVTFCGGNSKYNCGDPATSRNDTLIGTYNWTITDGGLYTGDCLYYSTAPSITSYAPTGTIWPEVSDSHIFNVTTDQTTNCTWYINGSQVQYNTSATEHTYTNTSLVGGHWNVTAIANNTNGTDSQTWLFEVGADSITYIVLQDTPTNQSMIMKWNVTRIGSNVTDWGIWLNYTFSGWTYYFRFTNATEIMNQTASSNNESLWFNDTSLLPTGVYYINATSDTYQITLPLGWSIIGWTNPTASTAHSMGTLIGGNCQYVTERNSTTGDYVTHVMINPTDYNFAIERGWGYLVRVTAETPWARDS